MIPYGRQSISEEDIQAVCAALRSDYLTTGPMVEQFEQRFAEAVGAKHAVAVCNATAALHLAMMVAGIGPGDRVVTSPNTFVASANCAAYVGATPDFADIDPVSYCLCANSLEENWKPDTKAVVTVDYAGQTADMPAIAAIARKNGAIVIEDACHAVGGKFEHLGKIWSIGGHPWADMTTFSFHPVKTMTTGEGGMLVTDNDQYATTARRLRTHGIVRDVASFVGLGDPALDERGPWYYEMQDLGYNYRITDFQCALGLSQLVRLDQFLERRREIVAKYNSAFGGHPHIQIPRLRNPADGDIPSWHLYTLQIDFPAIGKSRTILMSELKESGIGSQVLYMPVYLQPWYRRTYGYKVEKCPSAEQFYLCALSLPLYPGMTDDDVQNVIKHVAKFGALR
jgi:perosamine synthetase